MTAEWCFTAPGGAWWSGKSVLFWCSRLGVWTPVTPSQKIPLLYPEALESPRGAGRTPGSLNWVKGAGSNQKSALLHTLPTIGMAAAISTIPPAGYLTAVCQLWKWILRIPWNCTLLDNRYIESWTLKWSKYNWVWEGYDSNFDLSFGLHSKWTKIVFTK